MNDLQENIRKATLTASLLGDDIYEAMKSIKERPEGKSMGDKAIAAILSDLREMAKKIESSLNRFN